MLDKACTPKEANFKVGLWRMFESVADEESSISDHQEGPISIIRRPASTFHLVT